MNVYSNKRAAIKTLIFLFKKPSTLLTVEVIPSPEAVFYAEKFENRSDKNLRSNWPRLSENLEERLCFQEPDEDLAIEGSSSE